MYSISKAFSFSASHRLLQLPDDHPCHRLHGHNYTVEVVFEREELDGNGFIIDYNDLRPIRQYLDNHFDHRHLNEVLPMDPTAENIARYLFLVFGKSLDFNKYGLAAVRVSETGKTWAEYRE